MRLVSPFRALGLLAACACMCVAQAQTAREIVDSTTQTYQKLTSYQVQAVSRSVRVFPMPMMGVGGPSAAAPRYVVSAGAYTQISLKLRKPDDWSLATQTFSFVSSRGAAGRPATTPGTPPEPVTTFNSIARWGNQPPQRGRMTDVRFDAKPLPSSEFANELRVLLLPKNAREPVLAQFDPPSGGFSTARPFTVVNPELVDDPEGDGSAYKIRGKTSAGETLVVWIDKSSRLVAKAWVYRRESAMQPGFPSAGVDTAASARTQVTLQETIYRAQLADPEFQAGDFQLQTPSTLGPIDQSSAEWTPQNALIALVDEAPAASAKTEGAAETPAAPPPAPVAIDGQALTQEQMAGIVLIEGDGGTATGFMTKIRDVDFIVTNLHVLEGNKKLKLTTLRGEEIPMLGVFGAVGSDIAILRIGGAKGDLKLAKDVFAGSKIGDKVVVVGNRLGGGVATQTAGSIVGVGPTRVEVNANFEPGNSGSPIVNLATNEVVGVETYSETRRVDVDDRAASSAGASAIPAKVEKRWFGYRLDCVSKWETIDLAKWNAQGERIDKFRETSEALHAFIRFDFKTARQHPRLTALLDGFETRYRAAGNNGIVAATEVKDLFRVIRTISDDGVKDLTSGDYYDYFRSSLYWRTSIPAQLEYRKEIIDVLKKLEANSSLYVSRLRGN